MKITWPKNMLFESVELPCEEGGARGDKMVVVPSAGKTFIVTIHDDHRLASCVISLSDMLELCELVKAAGKRNGFDDK